jgi:RNA polymerase primary sigma factor
VARKSTTRQRRPAARQLYIDDFADRDILDMYIAETQRVPTRSAAEQKELARVMRDPKRSPEERAAAREELIATNLRFAFSIAKQYQHRGLDLADLIAEANTGLVRAADKYDPDVGVNFISYAVWWIRQAIHAAIVKQSRAVRVPLNRAGDLTRISRARAVLHDTLGREPTPEEVAHVSELPVHMVKDLIAIMQPERSLDEPARSDRNDRNGRPLSSILSVNVDGTDGALPMGLEEESQRELLLRALDTLPPRDRRVLMLYYGLEGEEPMTLEQIASIFGITRERVRQLRDRALAALRRGESAELLKREWAA